MTASLRILAIQLASKPGHIQANLQQIEEHLRAGQQQQADLVVFPELALTGAALQDMFFNSDLRQQLSMAMQRLAELSTICPFLIGLPFYSSNQLKSSCAFFSHGQLQWQRTKQILSTAEKRHFATDTTHSAPLIINDVQIQIVFGYELAHTTLGKDTALAIVLAADRFFLGGQERRMQQLSRLTKQASCPALYVNAAGCLDETIFAGQSCVMDAQGEFQQRARPFESDHLSLTLNGAEVNAQPIYTLSTPELVYNALTLSLRSYVQSCGVKGVLLGLSGGIDSALVLALAVDALGAEQVTAVMMPYHYTAQISQDDAAEQAQRMQVNYQVLPVASIVESFSQILEPVLSQWPAGPQDTTEQNLQARSRGTLLMALSNRSGKLLLTTSNKSETAVGYCTLYGDMAGGFAPLKDVPKTLVYQLAEYRNSISPVIPERVISRPPTAELAPGQQDTDSLPPYPILDEVIHLHLEKGFNAEAIIAEGFDTETVTRILRLIQLNEYKRQQAAPGPQITKRSFGRDRQMPLAARLHPLH